MIDVLATIALGLLAIGASGFGFRLVRGPTLPDRVVALDGLLTVIVCGIVVGAAALDNPISLDAILVVALVAFVGTGALARFVEQRGG